MKVAIASDHAGFTLKTLIVEKLRHDGYDVIDLGTHNLDRVDYPDYAQRVGEALQQKNAERGILLCGSGVGVCVAANKMRGIRAAICHDTYSAHQGVEHDDMNVLVLGAQIIGTAAAFECVNAFLKAKFDGDERYMRRLKKVENLENHQ